MNWRRPRLPFELLLSLACFASCKLSSSSTQPPTPATKTSVVLRLDGQSLENASKIDFGPLELGTLASSKTLSLQNLGSEPLPAPHLVGSGGIIVLSAAEAGSAILPGTTVVYTITVDTSSEGAKSCNLEVSGLPAPLANFSIEFIAQVNAVIAELPLEVPSVVVQMEGSPAVPVTNGQSNVSLGSATVSAQGSLHKTFTIKNTGSAALSLKNLGLSQQMGTTLFAATDLSQTELAPGASATFSLSLPLSAAGQNMTALLSFGTNVPGLPLFAFSVQATVVAAPVLPCVLSSQPLIKVLAVGDSITSGVDDNFAALKNSLNAELGGSGFTNLPEGPGYRNVLGQKLRADCRNIQFIGSHLSTPDTGDIDNHNEGYQGLGIKEIQSQLDTDLKTLAKPDVVLLMIGTANMFGHDFAPVFVGPDYTTESDLKSAFAKLLDDVHAKLPNAHIFVASPPKFSDNVSFFQTAFNEAFQKNIVINVALYQKRFADFSTDVAALIAARSAADHFHYVPMNQVPLSYDSKMNSTSQLKILVPIGFGITIPYTIDVPIAPADSDFYSWDPIHPTASGYGLMANAWYDAIEQAKISGLSK